MSTNISLRQLLALSLRLLLILVLVFPLPMRSDEVTTVTADRDATVNQAVPILNNGSGTTLSTHTASSANQRSLVHFSFASSGLDSNSAVKTSTLNLVPTAALTVSRPQEVRRISSSGDWTENGVSWLFRNGVLPWVAQGGDFDSTALASQPSGTTTGTPISFNLLADSTTSNVTQGWLNGTVPNFGLLVKDSTEDGAGWQYSRALTVTVGANAPTNGYNGYSAQVTGLNTSALITAGKMRSDCNDLRVRRFAANTWTDLDRQVLNCNTTSTTIWFRLQADIIANGSDTSYSVFYGNPSATAPPSNLSNVYLFYDDFESDTVNQPPPGWTNIAGTWTVQSETGNKFLRLGTAAAARDIIRVSSLTNERDVFVQANLRTHAVTGDEITGSVAGRVTGTTSANISLFKSSLSTYTGTKNAFLLAYVNGTPTTYQTSAYSWADNAYVPVGGAFFGGPTATLRNYLDNTLVFSITDAELNNTGSVGLVAVSSTGANYDFDNFLTRRYTEPEPTVTLAAESGVTTPLYGSRENSASNRPTLDVHYLRDVTLNPATPGISEITLNWAFPTGSTSSNYDGVLFARQAGAAAPSFGPSDGVNYLAGAQPVAGQYIAANTSAFSAVSVVDENGDNSVILPGSQYSYRAYSHDATAIIGAASTLPPHYSFGNTSTQTITTGTGGGANKVWSYKTGATNLAAPAFNSGVEVFTGGNDNMIHSMSAVNGGRKFQPGGVIGVTGGAISQRPSIIPQLDTSNPTCHNVCDVAYVTSGDGTVYAFRTDTGAVLWHTGVLTSGAGSGFQAAAAVQVKAYSGAGYTRAFDMVIVGTRNTGSTTNNKVYGLNGNTGATVWTANTGNVDFISGIPSIDYNNNLVWVTSRSNGSTAGNRPSLQSIDTNSGAVQSTFSLNNIDQSPTLSQDGTVVYVITNAGILWAIRTDLATCTRSTNLGITPSGFPIPVQTAASSDDVFIPGSNTIRKVHVSHGATCTWTVTSPATGWTNPVITSPSGLLATVGSPYFLYAGSSDGRLYKVNPSTGAVVANRLINAGATIGDPSFDWILQRFYVGDSSGRIYAFGLF